MVMKIIYLKKLYILSSSEGDVNTKFDRWTVKKLMTISNSIIMF